MDSPRREYIDRVLRKVRFRYDHDAIRRELDEHIQDLLDDLSPEDEAACIAQHMGDPDRLGEALDREHSPWLGWLWLSARRLAILMAVFCLIPALSLLLSGVVTGVELLQGYQDSQDCGAVTERMSCQLAGKVYETNIRVDELVLYENGTLELRYRTWNDPFSRAQPWSFSLGWVYDDKGRRYHGGGTATGGWVSLHQSQLADFDPAATALVIDYDYADGKFGGSIPLEWRKEG